MPLHRSFSNAPRFDRLEITPQFSAVLSDLVAGFAMIEWCEQRVCKLAPCDPQQFLQAGYGAEQIVWRCHPPVAFEIDEGNVLRRIKPDSHYRRNASVVFSPAVAFGGFSSRAQQQIGPLPASVPQSRVSKYLARPIRLKRHAEILATARTVLPTQRLMKDRGGA